MRLAPRARKTAGIQSAPRMKDPRVATVGATLLTPQKLRVEHEMDLVQITLGNHTLNVHYRDAFAVADAIKAHARQCKRIMHDTSKIWHGGSVLSNGEENYKFGR